MSTFSPGVQRTFTYGLPIAFVTYLGTAQLLGKSHDLAVPGWLAYLGPALGVALFVLAQWF